ncbi:MAG: IS4 family transposase, partial [Proteobacteria bacterium]|nr:IS4 family transposase [Pseudomonadota bacterium]
ACFCLQSGGLLSYRSGSLRSHELPLLRAQLDSFEAGDILLGDKGFCSYYDLWQLQQRGVDAVITLARRKPRDAASALAVLGQDDLLIEWPKPVWSKATSYSKKDWEALPEKLRLRQIKVTVEEPGFRVQSFYIVTSLLDPEAYSAADLAALYRQRWQVELFLRDIKTTMGMDILRCRRPAMVHKEILMHLIAYNAIRLLMFDAANKARQAPCRISFKASIQALRQWEPYLNRTDLKAHERRRLTLALYDAIAAHITLLRPDRSEPRRVKRRPKPFPLLNVPRNQYCGEVSHAQNPARAA